MSASKQTNLTSLDAIGALGDDDIPVAQAALLLSADRYPETDLVQYRHHLADLAQMAEKDGQGLQHPADQLICLQHILHDIAGYDGDTADYDHLDNASLVRVIDRKCGLPVALMILYLHVADAAGFHVVALNFPGHVFGRIGQGTDAILFDPFVQGQVVQAHDLRAAVKRAMGPQAELAVSYTQAMSRRDVLIRLQNNLKIRLLEQGREEEALQVINATRRIAPAEHRLLFDAGVLSARLGQRQAAIDLLNDYLPFAAHASERAEVIGLLRILQASLN